MPQCANMPRVAMALIIHCHSLRKRSPRQSGHAARVAVRTRAAVARRGIASVSCGAGCRRRRCSPAGATQPADLSMSVTCRIGNVTASPYTSGEACGGPRQSPQAGDRAGSGNSAHRPDWSAAQHPYVNRRRRGRPHRRPRSYSAVVGQSKRISRLRCADAEITPGRCTPSTSATARGRVRCCTRCSVR